MLRSSLASLRAHREFALLAVAFAALGAFRLNDISLYTDSTRYVIWGTSIAHAKGWVDDTQPEPEHYVVNAPLYPVLLSPILFFFPYSLAAAKVWTLLLGGLFLAVFYTFLLRRFGKGTAILGTIPLALNPLLIILSTEVLSESSFLAVMFLILYWLDRLEEAEEDRKSRYFLYIVLASSVVVLLREVALALVIALMVGFMARGHYKRAGLVLAGFSLIFGVWLIRNLVLVGVPPTSQAANISFIFEHFASPPSAPLIEEFRLRFLNNLEEYAVHLGGMLLFPTPEVLIIEPSELFRSYFRALGTARFVLPISLVPLLLLGIRRDVSALKSGLVRLLFVVGYLLVVLFYPVRDVRFLLPILPFMVYYPLVSLSRMKSRWPSGKSSAARAAAIGLVAIVALPNALTLSELLRTNSRYTSDPLALHAHLKESGQEKHLFTKPWRLMGEWIRRNVPDQVVIGASLKEIVPFVGDRKVLEVNNGTPLPLFDGLLRDHGAEYLLSTTLWGDIRSYEFQMAESRRFWFEPLTSLGDIHLYRIHPTYTTPFETWAETKRIYYDTTSATGLLRKGRIELVRRQYDAALRSFLGAQQKGRVNPMLAYQMTLAYAMRGELDQAAAALERMYRHPQSLTYMPAARMHLAYAQQHANAEQAGNAEQRALSLFEVSSFYWNFGYQREAYSILLKVLAESPAYFTGLLWAWHYATQLGDSTQAMLSLRELERIDRDNPVVVQFRRMTELSDSLRRAAAPRVRSDLHLAIARAYREIDLPGEAVDEAQRALRADPTNAEAWLFQAELFEKRNKPLAARLSYRRALLIDPNHPVAKAKAALE